MDNYNKVKQNQTKLKTFTNKKNSINVYEIKPTGSKIDRDTPRLLRSICACILFCMRVVWSMLTVLS